MPLTVLTGDDQLAVRRRRAELLAGSGAQPDAVARYNLEDETETAAFHTALATIPLFAGARYLEASPAHALGAATAALLRAVPAADTVVIHGEKPPAAAVVKDAGLPVETHRAPTGGGVRALVGQLAAEHQITLAPEQITLLADRCGHDPARLSSVMYSLAITGLRSPTDAHLDRFTAHAGTAPGVPWALTDLLVQGRLGQALALADTLEPIAALSYLATRLGQAGRILESGHSQPEEAASAFGLASLPAARNLIALAETLGVRGLAASWDLVLTADVAVKSAADPHAALDLTLVRLGALWTAPAPDALPACR